MISFNGQVQDQAYGKHGTLSLPQRKATLKEREAGDTANAPCPTCGKRIVSDRHPGSFTSYLFGAFDCACSGADAVKQTLPNSAHSQDKSEDGCCPRCGLRIAGESKVGSLTTFLFQDTHCQCPPHKTFADGAMSARFRQLKETNAGTVFMIPSAETNASSGNQTGAIDLVPGATIGGAYEIISLVGFGNMGEVYLASHLALNKKCALKVIPPDQVTEMGWLRFQLEAKTVAKLEHVNLVRVTDLGIHEECLPFYAMDYVEGQNLAELLDEHGPMPLNKVLEIFKQVCDGVYCAHRNGVLHRDLKPSNIMLVIEKSGTAKAKILDFGLVKLTSHDRSEQSLTGVGDVFGSPYYMSPEQCSGDKLDQRSDIYSLGCTMFELLTGRPPFAGSQAGAVYLGHLQKEAPSLESIAGPGKFPASMEIVMAKLLRKDPAERYQTMAELKGDLERVSRGESLVPHPVSRSKETSFEHKSAQTALASGYGYAKWPLVVLVIVGIAAIIVVTRVALTPAGKEALDKGTVKQIKATKSPEREAAISPLPRSSPGRWSAVSTPFDSKEKKPESLMVWDGKPFFRGIVRHSGKLCKSWVFPGTGLSLLGQLYVVGEESFPAQPMDGTVYLPASAQVEIAPSAGFFMWPDLQKGLAGGNFNFLCLRFLRPEQVDQLVTAVASYESLTGLYLYDIQDENKTFETTCLGIINRYPNLTTLYTNMLGDGRRVRQIQRLKMLRHIHLSGIEKNYEDVFSALRESTNLKELLLKDIPLSFPAFRNISTCSNLERLDCGRSNKEIQIQGYEISPLAHLKKLKKLKLEAIGFSPALIDALGKCQSLRELRCELDTEWSQGQKMDLRRALPDADIFVYWRVKGRKMLSLHYSPGQDQPVGVAK